jgi:hypothetical protein
VTLAMQWAACDTAEIHHWEHGAPRTGTASHSTTDSPSSLERAGTARTGRGTGSVGIETLERAASIAASSTDCGGGRGNGSVWRQKARAEKALISLLAGTSPVGPGRAANPGLEIRHTPPSIGSC